MKCPTVSPPSELAVINTDSFFCQHSHLSHLHGKYEPVDSGASGFGQPERHKGALVQLEIRSAYSFHI